MAKQTKFAAAYEDACKKLDKAEHDLARSKKKCDELIRSIPKLKQVCDSLAALCGKPASQRKSEPIPEAAPLPEGFVKAEACEHGVVKGERCNLCDQKHAGAKPHMIRGGGGGPAIEKMLAEDKGWEGVTPKRPQ